MAQTTVIIRKSPPQLNHGSGVCKLHFVSRNWHMENKICSMLVHLYIYIDYSYYLKSLISRMNEVYVFFNNYSDILLKITPHKLHLNRLFCCNHTCNIVSVTSASCYHQCYQSRSSMYIRGLFPRNFAKLAEAVPIAIVILRLSNQKHAPYEVRLQLAL